MKAISAVLLAAGRSSRMKQLKALLPWKGLPLIESQITEILSSTVSELIVVLGYEADTLIPYTRPYPVKVVINKQFANGKTSSIIKGLQAVDPTSDAVFIISVDQPVTYETLERMIRHLNHAHKKIAIPVFNGKRGHPVLFSTELMHDLMTINEQTEGLRQIVRKYDNEIAEVFVSDRAILYNFNRPIDYDIALRETSEGTYE